MNKAVLLISIFCLFNRGNCACSSIPSALQTTWISSNYGTIIINATTVTLEQISFNINGVRDNTQYECYSTTGLTVVVKSVQTLPALGSTGNAYICFDFTRVNDNSYYYYLNSPINNLFNNDRVVFWRTTDTAPTLAQVCSETPSAAEFKSLVRVGSETSAKTNCMTPILGNFYYTMTTTSGVEACSGTGNSILSVCDDRQTLKFNVSLCGGTTPVMFTTDGNLGCLSVITSGSTYYSGLYNFDAATPGGVTTTQFACIAVTQSSDGTVNVNARSKDCVSTQSTTTRQSDEELYVMTPYVTCPFTDDPGVNVLAIVLGILGAIVFIIIVIIIIWWCCKKKKKRDRIKEKERRNLKVFEKKMAMDEFDDEHPLNETSLVPDYPQNGYPVPLKISPRSKRYNVPKVSDVEIQTERSLMTDRDFDQMSNIGVNPQKGGPLSNRSFGAQKGFNGPLSNRSFGPQRQFHGSNRTLATQNDFESHNGGPWNQQHKSINSKNPTLKNNLHANNPSVQEFPTEPQFLPWPWRTANRAMKTNTMSTKTGFTVKSSEPSMPDLGEYTIKTYGIKYDDTLSTTHTHPPPRRPLSRANSVYDLSRPPTRMLEMRKAHSQNNLNRAKTSMGHYPTPNTLLNRSVSQNDVSILKPNYKPFERNKYLQKPQSKPNAPSRRASVASIKSMMIRSRSRMLKPISESKERIPTPLKVKRKPPLPSYMRPFTRSKTTIPAPSALKKAANIYGKRPSTGHLKENARSLLMTKLKQRNMEKPVRKKKKVLRKKRSTWKSPFALPSSMQPRPLSLRKLSKMKHSKVEPMYSNKTSARWNESMTSRDFATTDDFTSDSNGENFLDAEVSTLPPVEKNTQLSPKREKTYRLDKKRIVSEDSGISADESPTATENDDNMMFRVKQVIDKGKFKVVTPRGFPTPQKKFVPFHLPDYLKS